MVNIDTLLRPLPSSHSLVKQIEDRFGSKLITMRQEPLMPKGNCYWNADAYVSKNGGAVEYGWMLLLQPKAFVMAMHHAVVRVSENDFLDVTGTPFESPGYTSFILDSSIVPPRDYPAYIANKFWIIRKKRCIHEYIRLTHENIKLQRARSEVAKSQGCPYPNAPFDSPAIIAITRKLDINASQRGVFEDQIARLK